MSRRWFCVCCASSGVRGVRHSPLRTRRPGLGDHGLPDFKLKSEIANEDVYFLSRDASIDDDEKIQWDAKTVEWLAAHQGDPCKSLYETLRDQIRHGVPDYLKSTIWPHAQDIGTFLKQRPGYYAQRVFDTFGGVIPADFQTVPTFSGGFLGVEEQIVGSPVEIGRIESLLGNNSPAHLPHGVSWTHIDGGTMKLKHTSLEMFTRNNPESRFPLQPLQSAGPGISYEAYKTSDAPPISPVRKKRNSLFGSLSPLRFELHHHDSTPKSVSVDHHLHLKEAQTPARLSAVANERQKLRHMRSRSVSRLGRNPSVMTSCTDHSTVTNIAHASSHQTLPLDRSPRHDDRLPLLSFPQMITEDSSPPLLDRRGNNNTAPEELYTLESVTHLYHLLTPKGLAAAKRLLWVLNASCPDLEFNPMIASLTCVSLLYLDEEATFILLYRLIEAGRRSLASREERVFLTLRRTDYIRFVKLVKCAADKHLGRVVARLELLGIDVSAWIARCLSDGLATTVSFNVLIRIYTSFIFSGAKELQRYLLGILKMREPVIMKATTGEEAYKALLFYLDCISPQELNQLTKQAYKFVFSVKHRSIANYDSLDIPTPYLMSVKLERLYRPRLSQTSNVFGEGDWEFVWSLLPPSLHLCDPTLTFRNTQDGSSFTAMWRKLNNSAVKGLPMVFAILAESNGTKATFGGFAANAFDPNGIEDSSESLIFTLKPKRQAYFWGGVHTSFADISLNAISIGMDDCALWFDNEFHRGRTASSLSFGSEPLIPSTQPVDFTIMCFEVWTIR